MVNCFFMAFSVSQETWFFSDGPFLLFEAKKHSKKKTLTYKEKEAKTCYVLHPRKKCTVDSPEKN